jgi:hypothetical protein
MRLIRLKAGGDTFLALLLSNDATKERGGAEAVERGGRTT